MPKFEVRLYNPYPTKHPVGKLVRDGKVLPDDFFDEIKKDNNLEPELGELFAHVKTIANGYRLPKNAFRILDLGKLKYTVYEVKSSHLRLYLFQDKAHIIVIGGKKGDQEDDLEKLKSIIKEYTQVNTK